MLRKYLPYGIIAILLAILVLRKQETITITVPEKKGQFEVVEPEPVVNYDTIFRDGETKVVEVPNEVNEELLDKYNSLKDSVAKLDFVKEAITERTYNETFQDSTQRITVESKVIGTLKSQRVDYTIFPQQIEVKAKRPKYSLYAGTYSIVQPNTSIGAELTLQAPKTNYTIGYDSNKNLMAGVAFKIF